MRATLGNGLAGDAGARSEGSNARSPGFSGVGGLVSKNGKMAKLAIVLQIFGGLVLGCIKTSAVSIKQKTSLVKYVVRKSFSVVSENKQSGL